MRGRMSSLILILPISSYWYIFQYHMKIILAPVYLLSRTLTHSNQNTDSQKIKIMLKAAQLINIFKDVFIKCSKFPLFRFPGIVGFLKSEDFYPRDSGFFQICGFFKSGDFSNLGIFIPGIWDFWHLGIFITEIGDFFKSWYLYPRNFYPQGSGIVENLGIFIGGDLGFLSPRDFCQIPGIFAESPDREVTCLLKNLFHQKCLKNVKIEY